MITVLSNHVKKKGYLSVNQLCTGKYIPVNAESFTTSPVCVSLPTSYDTELLTSYAGVLETLGMSEQRRLC